MKLKIYSLFLPVILLLIFDYWFLFIKKDTSIQTQIQIESVCAKDCKEGNRILLNDGSSWHILKLDDDKVTLFSDANIDLEGNFLPLDPNGQRNTGVPVPFDKQNERKTENNPYCIFSDLGCSAYQKNNIDVFEDSYIKRIIDSKFLPKITNILGTSDIIIRLMKLEEFRYFKDLETINNTQYKWLYYSGYWLMTPYTNYSVFVHKEQNNDVSVIAPYINHGYGIRPVIEVKNDIIFK